MKSSPPPADRDISGRELSLIEKIRQWCQPAGTPSTDLGIGDDAAIIQTSGRAIFFCSDLTIEGTHFDSSFSTPEDIGHKSLTRVLSDIAAMSGKPLSVTISIAIPKDWSREKTESFLEAYYRGAVAMAQSTEISICGGDLSRTAGPLTIDVAAIGEPRPRAASWRRSGARPGDIAVVSGPLGEAAWALREFLQGHASTLSSEASSRHRRPSPRLDIAARLAEFPVNAAIDISDGLVIDASRLCAESHVTLTLEESRIPKFKSLATLKDHDARDLALYGGDDYELLLAIPLNWWRAKDTPSLLASLGMIQIGSFAPETRSEEQLAQDSFTRVYMRDSDINESPHLRPLPPRGHDPF